MVELPEPAGDKLAQGDSRDGRGWGWVNSLNEHQLNVYSIDADGLVGHKDNCLEAIARRGILG